MMLFCSAPKRKAGRTDACVLFSSLPWRDVCRFACRASLGRVEGGARGFIVRRTVGVNPGVAGLAVTNRGIERPCAWSVEMHKIAGFLTLSFSLFEFGATASAQTCEYAAQ